MIHIGPQFLGAQLVADNSSLAEKPNPRQDVAVPLQSSASCRTQHVSCFAQEASLFSDGGGWMSEIHQHVTGGERPRKDIVRELSAHSGARHISHVAGV